MADVRERVLVAMSGGVDSSVTAALLVESGAEVVGITMHLAGDASRCCSLDDADDARRVAESLGVRFFVANYTELFDEEVVRPFADAYMAGRTPIPCVICNKRFKFDHLMERARILGASRVATGHYARVCQDPETGRFQLRRPADRDKDQTYFLFQLDQAQLACTAFPLGDITKDEVRRRARALGLVTADKPESQEICFVPDGDYAKVVERLRPDASAASGDIVDESGRVLGQHAGIHRFTVGQRHGLGISADRRLYVTRLEPASQRVVVGGVKALDAKGAVVEGVSWIDGGAPSSPLAAIVQVRHRHEGAAARIEPIGGDVVRVHFEEPVRAVAPGQAAVFYCSSEPEPTAGQRVLGGGWIREALR